MSRSRPYLLVLILLACLATPSHAAAATDLTVSALGNPPTQLVTRGTLRPSVTVRDAGTTPALASRTSVWLSRDRVVGSDVLVASVATTGIRAGRTASLRPTLRLPATVRPGRWYLVSCADHLRRVRESNERNNCRVSLGAVRVFAPTLTVSSPAGGQTVGASTSLQFASNVALAITCSLDGATPATCANGTTFTLASGAHTLRVRGVDAASNVLVRDITWTVDATAPTIGFTDLSDDLTNDRVEEFGFGASETSTFECRVDDGAFAACSSPFTANGLADGVHTFGVRATDPFGNVSGISAHAWTVDATAPETTITSGPTHGSFVSSTGASFGFSSTDGVTYQCSLDGAITACSSPRALSGLAEAPHTFTVTATDAAGNTDPTPASRTWTVDRTGPASFSIVQPPIPTGTSVTIGLSADEPMTLQCRILEPAAAAHDWQACGTPQSNPSLVDVAYTDLVDGDYSLEVAAVDRAGNPAQGVLNPTWTIDTIAPSLGFTGGPSDNSVSGPSTMFSFAASGATSVACMLDDGAWVPCTSPHSLTGLSHGQHNLQVRALDDASNATYVARTWNVDAQPPETTILSPTEGQLTSDNTPTFTFTATEQGSSWCRIDAGSWFPCASPHTTTTLADGPHTFAVAARDGLNNEDPTPATRTITIDTTPPDTTLTSTPATTTNSTTASFSFTSPDPTATFQCQLGNTGYSPCVSPKVYSGLGSGSYSFQVRASDAANNTDGFPASFAWTIDATPPNTTITSMPPSQTSSRVASFSFSSSEAGSFECSLDGGSYTPCASGVSYSSLSDATHSFQVQAIDNAGNRDPSPASYFWTVDGTPPVITFGTFVHDAGTTKVNFSVSENAVLQCAHTMTFGSPSWGACTDPTFHLVTDNVSGGNKVWVKATDSTGNASQSSTSW